MSTKKPYKPKPAKVEAMRELYKKATGRVRIKFTLLEQTTKILLVLVLFSSCSANWHLRRAIAKDPTILESKTITLVDTIHTDPVTRYDTIHLLEMDTVEVITDSISYRIIRQRDSFWVKVTVPPDTIIKTKEVQLPPQIKYIERDPWYKIPGLPGWIWLIPLVIITLGILRYKR